MKYIQYLRRYTKVSWDTIIRTTLLNIIDTIIDIINAILRDLFKIFHTAR